MKTITDLAMAYVHSVVERQRWPFVSEASVAEKLLPKTLEGISRYLMSLGREPLGVAMRPTYQLPECLKHAPDDPAFFPSGKWATIQRIEQIVGDPNWAGDEG